MKLIELPNFHTVRVMFSLITATALKSHNRLLIRFTPEMDPMAWGKKNLRVGWIHEYSHIGKYSKLESHQMYVLNVPGILRPVTKQWLRKSVLNCTTAYLDSSNGCCTVSSRGCRSLVSCWTPRFKESIIWSFSNFWYLSISFLSKTKTATS